jgi:LemA protein
VRLLLVPLALVAAIAVWMVYAFNRLVRHRNLVSEAWSGIDVQLKRRHDLLPALVETVRGHATFERETLEELTALRGGVRPGRATRDLQDRENALSSHLRTLLAVAEAYPELRAGKSFLALQAQLAEIENQLQMARRYHNGSVRDYNIAVESFPSNVVAALFAFQPEEFFQVESATERGVPAVTI